MWGARWAASPPPCPSLGCRGAPPRARSAQRQPVPVREASPTQLVRRGRPSAFGNANVSGEGGVGLKAGFVSMADRDPPVRYDGSPAPEAVDPGVGAHLRHANPGICRQSRMAPCVARSPPACPTCCCGCLREPEALDPTAELLAIADALARGARSLMPQRRPISPISRMVNLLIPRPATTDGWRLLRSQAHHAAKRVFQPPHDDVEP